MTWPPSLPDVDRRFLVCIDNGYTWRYDLCICCVYTKGEIHA